MRHFKPLLTLLFLAAARASACPLCAGSSEKSDATTSVWWAVGAFLLVPPILAAFVLGAMRRELKKEDRVRDGVPAGLARFKERVAE